MTMQSTFTLIATIVLWGICALSLLSAFVLQPYWWTTTALFLAAALLFAPPIRDRLLRFWPASIGTVIFITAMFIVGQANDAAMKAGYKDIREFDEATALGITSPDLFYARKKAESEKAAAKAHEAAIAQQVVAEQAAIAENRKNAEKEAAERAATQRLAQEQRANGTAAPMADVVNPPNPPLVNDSDGERGDDVAACKKQLGCWAEKKLIEATFACRPRIERMAQYQFEWTDGFFEQKMSHYRWQDPNAGVVMYIGDKIKLQNGFGAWQYYTYFCDYDSTTKAVTDIRLKVGRLPVD